MITVKLLPDSGDLLTGNFNVEVTINESVQRLSLDEAQELRNKVNDAVLKALIFQALSASEENKKKYCSIIINGQTVEFYDKTMSYHRVIGLAGKNDGNYIVTFFPINESSGILHPYQVINVTDGMIFNVAETGNG